MADLNKVIIAFDSFKGCMSSKQANAVGADAVRHVMPRCEVVAIPVADGGEGFASACAEALRAECRTVEVHAPLGDMVTASYFMDWTSHTAILEMAQASGLTLVREELRNPLKASSFGTGEMILDAVRNGARTIIVGLGGSATNDGGMGMLTALGVGFHDKAGHRLRGVAEELPEIDRIDLSGVREEIHRVKFVIACDVQNPLLGIHGATFVFGPQKGADENMLGILEKGMRNLVVQTRKAGLPSCEQTPGAGAAGGLGFALMSFLNASIKRGIDLILDVSNFDKTIKDAALIITGEGSIDAQTCSGKTALGILSRAKKYDVPVIALGGKVNDFDIISKAGFISIQSIINHPMSLEQCMDKTTTENNIRHCIIQILNIIKYFHSV